ncbi:MAG: 3-phosphoserine/phosphohydroxythreonine transaminase [Dissulfurispiraceae bacterium]
MSNTMNFSAGPGALPIEVLLEASKAVEALPETGISVLCMSHRSAWFRDVLDEAENNLRKLLEIPDNYHVIFMQGGSSLQFSMLPMNFLRGTNRHAEYIVSGYWSAKAFREGQIEGDAKVVWDGEDTGYTCLPSLNDLDLSHDATYLHYVSNETVEGLEFTWIPGLNDVPLVCDMSSNLLASTVAIDKYAFIYAHAQKNLGPSGVAVCILEDGFVKRANRTLPSMLDYRTHIQAKSVFNTPPVFSIYVLMLVTRWLRDKIGGLAAMGAINRIKADLIYGALDTDAGFYRVHSQRPFRSTMNIVFSLPNPSLETLFLEASHREGFHGLEGHRSIGGLRVSLYNAVSLDAANALSTWLVEFLRLHG